MEPKDTKKKWVAPEIKALDIPTADAIGVLGLCIPGASAGGGATACESGTGAVLTCRTGTGYGNYCGAGGNF